MEWKLGRRTAIVLAATAVLAGCAQVPRQAFNAQAAAHVKKVIVAHHENQTEYEAQMLGHPAVSFGLVGGLIAAADMQLKTGKLTKAIVPEHARVQERLGQRLKARLEATGYETEVVVLPAGTKAEDAVTQATQRAKGDAVMVVDLYAGYWAAGPASDYFPRMLAKVKTFDAQSNKVLYEDSITYGYAMPKMETVHLASEPTYRFGSIDVLTADAARAREGLFAGINALADQIAADLKK